MHSKIFINLPVADVDRSREFFTELGYSFDEAFSDEKAVCLVLGENMVAMLLQRDFFGSFHPVTTADATTTKECVVCVDAESRAAVDTLVDNAISAGAKPGDTEDHGFMYGRSYDDLDGHSWQIMWMDPAAMATGPDAASTAQS
ncbi:VOC family protein [Gordonia bronchialis]|uniref:VOC family protein n=1 Tax=Gordonia bronchialis TaxID=2054 RepID=UPI00242DE9B8|nr:glyoxalase [Gordonia bronchialis]